MALTMLLPLSIVLSRLVLVHQGLVTADRETLRRRLAVQAAFERVADSLRTGEIRLDPGESETIDAAGAGVYPVRGVVTRQPNAVVTLGGAVLPPNHAAVDLNQIGIDGEGRKVYQYRSLEVYLVEVEAGVAPVPSMRLLGVLARLPDGRIVPLGSRYDRALS
jgi:hypothetical protein